MLFRSPDTRRSITAFLAKYNGNTIDYKCQFQKIVSHSSTESEIMAADYAARRSQFLKWLIEGMGGKVITPIPIYIDNAATINISKNPIQPGRNAHMHARFFYLKDLVENKQIILKKISTNEQLADLLCAFKSTNQFNYLTSKIKNTKI